jgi:hypothetical protein
MVDNGDPIRPIKEVVIDGGPEPQHRAWPAIEIAADGALVVAYKAGPDHHKTDEGVLGVARSVDGGMTWPFRRVIAAHPGWDVFTNHGMTRLRDGPLLLHCVRARHIDAGAGRSRFYARGRFICSLDDGRTWREWSPELEFPFVSETERGFCYGRIHELSDGRLMVPFYGAPIDDKDGSRRILAVAFSHDRGRSWRDYSIISDDQAGDIRPSETDLIRLRDGRFLAIIRANGPKRLYRSYSADDGTSWSDLEKTELPGQSPCLIRLSSGDLLCGYRDRTENDLGMSCAVSRDDGLKWQFVTRLYRGGSADCGYPSIVRLSDDRIYCVFYTSPSGDFQPLNTEIRGLVLEDRSLD